MALARLAFKNLHQKASLCSKRGAQEHCGWSYGLLQRMSSSTSDGKEVAVQRDTDDQGGNKGRWKALLPKRPSLWRRKDTHHPFENLRVASLGKALMEAAENMNKLPQLIESAMGLMGRFKETNDSYKVRYDVPGLTHDDIKVTIDNGVLKIRGERKVEEGDETEDEYWMSYGSYNASLVLPDDAKQDDIKAELKDGVLSITIPKTESVSKDVKEVQIQ